ncbi:OLC1v1024383C2 [Oldenlandia corymbosa var. corymbosa]|uniref:OLC1v1024383C2 n=1 Tax=Oldenlandia corymbosa var. corymbosa TaxID=529605 RepID=A0AAV1C345_OLDCO|nr:OLC1v1024383C2 [Oldenlandia corymbosa var. corymbosa]
MRKKARHFLKTLQSRTSLLLHRQIHMDSSPTERYCYKPILKWNPQVEEYFIQAYGEQHFSRISDALTRPSCYSCIRVNTLKSTSSLVIEKLIAILQERGLQKGMAGGSNNLQSEEELVKESVDVCNGSEPPRIFLETDYVSKCQIPGLDNVVLVKGSGPHAVNYECKGGKSPKEVIVSRKCAEAVLRGAQVYVPGVLACSAHVEKGDSVAVSVAVEQPLTDGGWGANITRGTVLQGSESDPYHFERKGLYIGQGITMLSRPGIFRASEGIAVDMVNRVFRLSSFYELLEGEIFLQNLPSIVAARVLDPQPGERILDMCAAPGGKTTAIAILMKDEGEVIATDRSHNKVHDINKLAAEMGLTCIKSFKLDALKAVYRRKESDTSQILDNVGSANGTPAPQTEAFSNAASDNLNSELTSQCHYDSVVQLNGSRTELKKNIRKKKNGPGRNHTSGGRVEKSQGFLLNSFDRVLLDAPCSALGLRPRLFAGEETVESLRNHAKYQRRMFDQAVQLVRPGGVIVYSTCTINPGENEGLVRYALDTYKFLSLAPQHPKVGGPGLVGSCQLSDGYSEQWLKLGEEDLVQRFDPSSAVDTIGFFIAKFTVGPKDDVPL